MNEPAGSILFTNSKGQRDADNQNLFWDNTNKRLGVGNNTPAANIDCSGSIFTGTGIGIGVAAATQAWCAIKPANDNQPTFMILNAEGAAQIQSNGNGIWAIRCNIQGHNALEVRGPVAIGQGFAGEIPGVDNGLIVSGPVGCGESAPDHSLTVGANTDTSNVNMRVNGATVASTSSSTPSAFLKVNVNGTDYALALLPL